MIFNPAYETKGPDHRIKTYEIAIEVLRKIITEGAEGLDKNGRHPHQSCHSHLQQQLIDLMVLFSDLP